MGKTFAEKVLSKRSGRDVVAGDIVTVGPDHLLTHDNTFAIVSKIEKELAEFGVFSPNLPVIVLDHVIPASDEKIAAQHAYVRKFVKQYNLPNFFDVGSGVCHQVVVEKGLAPPMGVVVGSDSHTCTYGAVGCFATGVDRTEAASLILGGELWLRVPQTIKIVLNGARFCPGTSAKDLILAIAKDLTASGGAYCSLEFHGPAIPHLTIDERMTIANMGVELDAKIAVFPFDDVTRKYYIANGKPELAQSVGFEWADADAQYIKVMEYDIEKLEPLVALPHSVDKVVTAASLAGKVKIDQFLLGTCTNGRYTDLKAAAEVLRGHHVKAGCRMIVGPASTAELKKALKDDTIATLVEAGGVVLPSGCGPCLGAHQGVLAPQEICLSTANRNFKGRMGCKDAFIYLCSPETLAASAIEGTIVDPRPYFSLKH